MLERLRERVRERASLEQAGVDLTELPSDADAELSRTLAKLVGRGDYVFAPVIEHEAFLGGKLRKFFRAPLADTVVLFAVARVLHDLTTPAVSERVYSYKKGRSSRQAVRDLVRFARAHCDAEPDVKARGLHVLRRDVKGYGDLIPVHDASPLWPLLERVLGAAGCPPDAPYYRALRDALRPLVQRMNGSVDTVTAGVPMGSPLQVTVCNLYLDALDRELEAIPGAFYARFGDDIAFAHASATTVRRANESMERHLSALGLSFNQAKSRDLFWNGAGRQPHERVSEAERGTTHVEYLGSRVAFGRGVAPSRRKLRRIQAELRERIVASERLLRDAPLEERTRSLAAAVAQSLEPHSEVALSLADELWTECDDRRELAALDRFIARELAHALSGAPGSRGLRSAPPRFLRENGLISLVGRRQRNARPRREDGEGP